ncbi:MAG: chitobiase/beta-hexosaminidase C-terminal domain-containing protein, partial [Oscillospiraceae bacterium]|nr:chitobiase/beta-hexosaminidase C-terminal domain-containing protein [Oscillospiraceae bacterium]
TITFSTNHSSYYVLSKGEPEVAKAQTPVFVTGPTFTNTKSVTITTTDGSEVYFKSSPGSTKPTVGATLPTKNNANGWTKYTEPINISATTSFIAVAIKDGMFTSSPQTMTYTKSSTTPGGDDGPGVATTTTTPAVTTSVSVSTATTTTTSRAVITQPPTATDPTSTVSTTTNNPEVTTTPPTDSVSTTTSTSVSTTSSSITTKPGDTGTTTLQTLTTTSRPPVDEDEFLNILKQEEPVVVLADIDGSVISPEILKAIKEGGKDVKVVLDDGYTYIIKADSITDDLSDFDLEIDVDLTGKAAVVNDEEGVKVPGNSIVISPNFIGEFGFEISFNFTADQLKDSGINGNNVKLFYVDGTGKVTDNGKLTLNSDGSVDVTISHASFYVLSEEEPISAGDSRYNKGDILGSGKSNINDALEILRYLAKLDSEINKNTLAYNAALIVDDAEKPTINDALEVLKYLAKLDSKVTARG